MSDTNARREALRGDLEAFRARAAADAAAAKSSTGTAVELGRLYGRLDEAERQLADEIVAGWVLSEDEAKRWDACWLIQAYGIGSAVAALRELEARLEHSPAPGDPYEATKVNRLVAMLGAPPTS